MSTALAGQQPEDSTDETIRRTVRALRSADRMTRNEDAMGTTTTGEGLVIGAAISVLETLIANAALTPAQADGCACVVCGRDFRGLDDAPPAHRPVGHSATGSQVFACAYHCFRDMSSDRAV